MKLRCRCQFFSTFASCKTCNMKKIIFILFCTFSLISSYSQRPDLPLGEKIYENPKYNNSNFLIVGDTFQLKGDYISSLRINQLNLKEELKPALLYRIAISYAQLNMTDSAFCFLNQYIDHSWDDRIIIVDKNFDNLRKDSLNWSLLIDKIEANFLNCLSDSVDQDLALRLFYLGIEDQKYRTLLPNMKQVSRNSIVYNIKKTDTLNLKEFDSIIAEYGFPTISKAGQLGSNNACMIVIHTDNAKKYYPLYMKGLLAMNEIYPLTYALITDVYLIDCHKRQLYGTQLRRNLWTMIWYPCKTVLYRVKDFKNVNKRREEIGFNSTVEEYVKSFGREDYIIPRWYYGCRKRK